MNNLYRGISYEVAKMLEKDHFFEGAEKLLEVWFYTRDCDKNDCDLRKIPRERLDELLELVKCEVISFESSLDLDAYVLSESSMFISENRFILKTCGKTTPLNCLSCLFQLAEEYGGFDGIQDLFYSRKNFKRPELQMAPHKNFEEESEILNYIFKGEGGRAYCLGSLHGENCWYLYVVTPKLTKRVSGVLQLTENSRRDSDVTLEVLMSDVDQAKMKYFKKESYPDASQATDLSGIGDLISGVAIDDHQFHPCGYSMNGVSRNVPGGYMTIHVTPEREFSYVSFETNIPHADFSALITRVVEIFGPKQFVVTFFSSQSSKMAMSYEEETETDCGIFRLQDMQTCRLSAYDLSYALYTREPFS